MGAFGGHPGPSCRRPVPRAPARLPPGNPHELFITSSLNRGTVLQTQTVNKLLTRSWRTLGAAARPSSLERVGGAGDMK